jgi:hypothetical protein
MLENCYEDEAGQSVFQAEQVRVVLDNLSTHSGALYETFPAPEAHRVMRRLEFHYTPKHASWLNLVEIEIGVLRGQCLDRRIGERDRLRTEIAAWEQQRNAAGSRVTWMFTTERAPPKWRTLTPTPAKSHNPCAPLLLGSVEIHRELMTAATRWIIAWKLWSVLSARMAIRLNSLSLQKKFSIR